MMGQTSISPTDRLRAFLGLERNILVLLATLVSLAGGWAEQVSNR